MQITVQDAPAPASPGIDQIPGRWFEHGRHIQSIAHCTRHIWLTVEPAQWLEPRGDAKMRAAPRPRLWGAPRSVEFWANMIIYDVGISYDSY